jgi:hypothetical protein
MSKKMFKIEIKFSYQANVLAVLKITLILILIGLTMPLINIYQIYFRKWEKE